MTTYYDKQLLHGYFYIVAVGTKCASVVNVYLCTQIIVRNLHIVQCSCAL